MQSLRDRENLHKSLERKAELAARGEKMAQQILEQAEAEVEAKIGKRDILISLFKRSIRSSNLNDFSYNKQIDGQIKLKQITSACMENWN